MQPWSLHFFALALLFVLALFLLMASCIISVEIGLLSRTVMHLNLDSGKCNALAT